MTIRKGLAAVLVAASVALSAMLVPTAASAKNSARGTLVVKVVGSSGQPLAGVSVDLFGDRTSVARTGLTKADGTFTRKLPLDTYFVSVSDPDEILVPRASDSTGEVSVRVRKNRTSSRAFTLLQPGTIEGNVTRDDAVRPRIKVTVGRTDADNAFYGTFEAKTSSTGAFSIDGLSPGTYYVAFTARDFAYLPSCYGNFVPERDVELDGINPCAGSTKVVVSEGNVSTLQPELLTHRAGTVRGVVRHADGTRPAGVTFTLYEGGRRTTFTSDTGKDAYALRGVPPGTYRIKALSNSGYKSGYERYGPSWFGGTFFDDADTVTVTGGQTTSHVDFTLRPTVRVRVSQRTTKKPGRVILDVSVTGRKAARKGKVTVLIVGRTVTVPLSNGKGLVKFSKIPAGDYTAKVRYVGTKTWSPLSKKVFVEVD
ncbi:MAG: hypothetical protein JWP10_794 [Nocardioidaceae bacterium]|nr:hypothetical protein [Nocardioidaceae bacterium]